MSLDLLIDIGNSRIKWAYSQNGRLIHHGSAKRSQSLPDQTQTAWLENARPVRVIAANVAGDAFADLLDQWAQRHWQQAVDYIKVEPKGFGIELAYAEIERFGVDRWLALVAARQLHKSAVAVIDAGTAVTLDVISAEGQHLGGIIVPGLALMSEALRQKSTGIQYGIQGARADQSALFGADTHGCIEKGGLYAVTGAIEHVLHRFVSQNGLGLSVLICGGDAERVMAELNIECQHIPDLVLQGMQIVKGAS